MNLIILIILIYLSGKKMIHFIESSVRDVQHHSLRAVLCHFLSGQRVGHLNKVAEHITVQIMQSITIKSF